MKKLQIEIEEMQKKILFLKQDYYETGARSTRWLVLKWRKQQADSTIHKTKHPETGTVYKYIDKIQECFENYYKNPYSKLQPDDNHIENLLLF